MGGGGGGGVAPRTKNPESVVFFLIKNPNLTKQ